LFYELSYDRKMCGYLILDSNCMQDRWSSSSATLRWTIGVGVYLYEN
jgi:hypothetical protein